MDLSQPYSPQGTKRKARKESPEQVFSCKFCGIFLRTPPVAVSEDEHDETKLLYITSRLKMLSLNGSFKGRIG